ncbi:MAG: Fic family protein [Actinomycetaceae bacterium]|nr:Fic family protein [Actinomycetaceae bacterium]
MVLPNKLGISSSIEIASVEERLSKMRALEMSENNLLPKVEVGKYRVLAKIHSHLFQDIYDFAGRIRSRDISEGGFRFVPVRDTELRALLQDALTPQTADRQIFMKGLDASYEYEGYSAHPTWQLWEQMDFGKGDQSGEK